MELLLEEEGEEGEEKKVVYIMHFLLLDANMILDQRRMEQEALREKLRQDEPLSSLDLSKLRDDFRTEK